jgi:hypothetical protein
VFPLSQNQTVEDVLTLLKERPDDVELYKLLGGLYFKQRDAAIAPIPLVVVTGLGIASKE